VFDRTLGKNTGRWQKGQNRASVYGPIQKRGADEDAADPKEKEDAISPLMLAEEAQRSIKTDDRNGDACGGEETALQIERPR